MKWNCHKSLRFWFIPSCTVTAQVGLLGVFWFYPPKLSSVELAKNQSRQYDKSFSYFCNQHTFGHRCFICRIHFNFRRKVKLKWKVKFKNKVNIKRRKVNLKMRRGKCETIYCFYNLIILLFVVSIVCSIHVFLCKC